MQALRTTQLTLPHESEKAATWLQVLSHVDPEFGGIASSVPELSRATEAQGGPECPIAGFSGPLERVSREDCVSAKHYSANRLRWMLDHTLRRQFRDTIRATQGVHIHGVWEPHCAVAAAAARVCKRPYVISAHGMLDQWALKQKRVKKAFYAALIEARNLQRASCLRALTAHEVDDYRRVGLTNPIAIVPNGIDLPPGVSGNLFWETYPHLAGRRIVLFMGRIHKKKGLDLLLQAWARIPQKSDDVHVVIAGPDFDGSLSTLQQSVEKLGLQKSVTFAGMLRGAHKWSALRAASVFVLPSHSEGFSVAILEGLSMGVPVIVTEQCHIPEIADYRCGWIIQPDSRQVEQALTEFLQLPPEEAVRMGERGRTLVENRFRWPVVGKQMADVYNWLSGGPKPTSVEIA